MKVYLTAFGGKLRSDFMDWPDDTKPEINMMMSMQMPSVNWDSDIDRANKVVLKRGKFQRTSKYIYLNGQTAAEYVLVDIS